MSSSTVIPLSSELLAEWTRATSDEKPYRYLQIKIQKENLNLVASSAGTPSVSKDFDEMQTKVADGESCYFLFRIAGPKNWVLISYIPEGKAKVSDKMLYAATKNTLKSKLGPQFINEETHSTAPEELTYSYYVKSKEPVNALSEFEKIRLKIHKEEDDERSFREEITQQKDVGTSQKIGGYHQVTIPLTQDAKDEIEKIKSGVINFIELRINDKATQVDLVGSKSVGANELPSHVKGKEPRFYLYVYQKIRSPGLAKANAFIYYCPDDSPQNQRMVYATSKPTIAQQITSSGYQMGKKLEIRDGAELTEDYLQAELFSSRSPVVKSTPTRSGAPQQFNKPLTSTSYSAPQQFNKPISSTAASSTSRPVSTIGSKSPPVQQAPHPVYSLMGGSSNASTRKSVIMPPRGAYG